MDKKGDQFEETKKNPENDPSKPSSETVSYPKIDPKDGFVSPPLVTTSTKEVEDKLEEVSIGSETPTPRNSDTPKAPKSVTWSADLTREAPPPHSPPSVSEPSSATSLPREPNPYVTSAQPASPSAASSVKHSMNVAKETLGRWGKKMGETTRKAEDLAGNVWQHLKTGPSVADAAMGRIAQGTKVLAEGGYEKIFRHTFETTPEEQLQRWFACYLSTSAGPVMGILYLSTEKLAFCSDNPLSYTVGEQTEWSYYKVVIPLHQLKSVNPSTSHVKREKYIQVISVDNHEFWFMAFVNYDGAVKCLQEDLHNHNI